MPFDVKELMVDITKVGAAQFQCLHFTYHCPCTYMFTHPCLNPTYLPCKFGTYTCIGSIITCTGTIYCAGSNDPTILYQGFDKATLGAVREQLHAALKEVDQVEKRLFEGRKSAK